MIITIRLVQNEQRGWVAECCQNGKPFCSAEGHNIKDLAGWAKAAILSASKAVRKTSRAAEG
jgi:endogenous inhibitor of DNA gyrase (YacG/DUF329 family)